MDDDSEFEALADEAVSSWGGGYGYLELEDAITALYRARLEFPTAWTQDQRDQFIGEQASRDADEIGTRFDDLIDTVTERLRWRSYLDGLGWPDSEEINAQIDAARRAAIDDLRWRLVDEIPDEIKRVDREFAEEFAD